MLGRAGNKTRMCFAKPSGMPAAVKNDTREKFRDNIPQYFQYNFGSMEKIIIKSQ